MDIPRIPDTIPKAWLALNAAFLLLALTNTSLLITPLELALIGIAGVVFSIIWWFLDVQMNNKLKSDPMYQGFPHARPFQYKHYMDDYNNYLIISAVFYIVAVVGIVILFVI